jgi:hypothetical protein
MIVQEAVLVAEIIDFCFMPTMPDIIGLEIQFFSHNRKTAQHLERFCM